MDPPDPLVPIVVQLTRVLQALRPALSALRQDLAPSAQAQGPLEHVDRLLGQLDLAILHAKLPRLPPSRVLPTERTDDRAAVDRPAFLVPLEDHR
ncbi:hypothetical protein GCM10008957_27850 [Deinococcus ruber]|uniref:Uncharacterized protein n=1 Tax=Deinococcus ruber TaxID=1848197 RepID=A0A918F6I5_9DEIO|nr:hypothetical protein GCM10008957_27850 [Deinococcus ruber]